jgi:predicted SAM-dependent methyltransferase
MSIRSRLRPMIRPLVGPVWYRVWARIEARLAPVESRLSAIEARPALVESALPAIQARLGPIESALPAIESRLTPVESRLSSHEARLDAMDVSGLSRLPALEAAWRTHVPAFLNAVSSVGAFGHKLREVRNDIDRQRNELVEARAEAEQSRQELRRLADRIEFGRREVLFELAHGSGFAETGARRNERLEPRIIAVEKLAAAQAAGDIRLSLGSGHIPLPGYLNVDRRELPGVDIIADVDQLPFEPGTVSEIFSAHLVEHFPQERMRRQLLPYWRDLLGRGSAFRAITPDAAAMIAAVGRSGYPFDDFREVLFGAQDYEGDYHYNLFTPESMRGLLEEAGFRDIEVPVSGRRNGKCFEFEIVAARP